jgi:hypothetical protein
MPTTRTLAVAWLEYEAGGQPCVAAQLNRRIDGVKGQTQQGLLLMAALRRRSFGDPLGTRGSVPGAAGELGNSLAAPNKS